MNHSDSKGKWMYGAGLLVGAGFYALSGWVVPVVSGVLMLAWSVWDMRKEIQDEVSGM